MPRGAVKVEQHRLKGKELSTVRTQSEHSLNTAPARLQHSHSTQADVLEDEVELIDVVLARKQVLPPEHLGENAGH